PARSEKAPSGKLTKSLKAKSLDEYDTVRHAQSLNGGGVKRARSRHVNVQTEDRKMVSLLYRLRE
ncbi:MAG: hypothetical protein ABJZ69_09060, partial [Hyphomicrobiales bacterium]